MHLRYCIPAHGVAKQRQPSVTYLSTVVGMTGAIYRIADDKVRTVNKTGIYCLRPVMFLRLRPDLGVVAARCHPVTLLRIRDDNDDEDDDEGAKTEIKMKTKMETEKGEDEEIDLAIGSSGSCRKRKDRFG